MTIPTTLMGVAYEAQHHGLPAPSSLPVDTQLALSIPNLGEMWIYHPSKLESCGTHMISKIVIVAGLSLAPPETLTLS